MPSSVVRTFTDPVEYFTGIRNLEIVGIVQRHGAFRAKLTRIDLNRLWTNRFEEDLPRIVKVTPSRMRAVIVFATDVSQPAMQINGIEISQNAIVELAPDSEWYFRSSASCDYGSMSLAFEDFAAAGEVVIGRDLAPATFAHCITPPARALSRLRSLHDAACHLAQTAPDILAKPEVARALDQALVEAMVFCLTDNLSNDVRNVQRHHAKVMRRLEEVIMAKHGEPLYMPELAALVGASYWTLRECCQVYLGMSPKRYLWLRRMHMVRRALRRADAERTTVTEIASDHGFWELGRFSVAYRSLFGESPSAVLRRSV